MSVAALLWDEFSYHKSAMRQTATTTGDLALWDIPNADALIGYATMTYRVHSWNLALFLGGLLALIVLVLLSWRGRIARTALAVLAAGYALSGFDALRPMAAALLDLWEHNGASLVALPAGAETPLGFDFSEYAAVFAYPVPIAVIAASAWLLWATWRAPSYGKAARA